MSEKYRKKEVFECRECGKRWDVPGAAESCYNKHRLMDSLEAVDNHEALYIDDVIDEIEQMVENGEFDYEQSNE